jgi:hypothetical protein
MHRFVSERLVAQCEFGPSGLSVADNLRSALEAALNRQIRQPSQQNQRTDDNASDLRGMPLSRASRSPLRATQPNHEDGADKLGTRTSADA